ncbi:MAG: BON domain-containing protein [Pseudomonadota bacterium]|nr:BON domain-containing protein [Pseudomonadota bacterium]
MKTDETARAIRAALQRGPEVQQDRYPITVRGDDVVHLESDVDDIITKRKAVRLARLVAGLPPVIEDRLCVVMSGQVTSDALQGAVLDALRGEGAFRDMAIDADQEAPTSSNQDWIEVGVQGCRIRLTGDVNSLSHRRLTEVVIWWVPGCCNVDNRLHVRPPEADDDEEL